jgi:pentatricopeptide repeat protein
VVISWFPSFAFTFDLCRYVEVVGRCNDLIRRCNTMDAVLALVREMLYAGITPAESTYFAVMLVCRNTAVGPARAVEVYDAMRLNGVRVSKRTFDLALECTLRAKQVRDALRLKEDMQADGIPLGAKLFTSLLKCVADNDVGRRKGAKHRLIRTCKLFEEMLASGVPPPPASFNALIVAAQRARQPDLVARTFEEMVATGVNPSRETYETALSAVSAGGLVDTALDIFAAMRRDGFEPRKTTYNSLLEACAMAPQPRVEQAFEIFYKMTGDGKVVPNRRTFALLIDAAVRAGLPSFAFDAFDAMRAAGVEVTLSTYNRLIHAAGMKPNGVATALKLFEEIKARADVAPDEYTYGSLLAACAQAGDVKTASALVAEMESAGLPHNRITRHAYITSLGRTDKWREALEQYQLLRTEVGGAGGGAGASSSDVAGPSRETYSLLFDAVLSAGGAEAAIASVALDKGEGDGFIHGDRAAAARAVFRDGIDAGVYDEPIDGLDTAADVSVDLEAGGGAGAEGTEGVGGEGDGGEGGVETVRSVDAAGAGGGGRPLRVSFMSMTRAEAIVATLVLLESFATGAMGAGAVTEAEAEAALPSGLFIGAGPGTKGNAQRRMLAVESVLRAASLPCETVEDPRTYIIGVTRTSLSAWIKKHRGSFATVDLTALAAAAVAAV